VSNLQTVCHLTTVHPRHDTRIFEKMCKSLAEEFNVKLLVADGNGYEARDLIEIFDIGDFTDSRAKRMLLGSLYTLKKALSLQAELYHFHDPELVLVGLILKVLGKKVIYDVHEDVPRQILRKYWIPEIIKNPLSYMVRVLENFCSIFFDKIITVTPQIADRFAKTKVVVIRNYPSLKQFSMSPDDENSEVNRSNAIYVGAISENRGILQMVEAFEGTEHKFVLGGKFSNDYIKNRSEHSKGWGNVEFKGWLQREDVVVMLKSTLVGLVVLQPTGDYEDALPVKLFEYMAAGVAVVSSDFTIWKLIVDSENCGICVDPTSPHSIREALNYLLTNPSIAVDMGKRGRAAIIDKYNWESESKKLLTCYRTILGGNVTHV
jgi:glycosyltransferase involved in cell wall biosynthesis